jgi:hypothetical protein
VNFSKNGTVSKLLMITALPAAAGLILLFSGVNLPATLLVISGFGGLLWLFTRKPRPRDEMPSNTVSCCHYLGDTEKE